MREQYLRWGIFLSSALAIFIANIDLSIVNVVLPSLMKIFSTTFNDISLVNLTYMISLTAFLMVAGKLSDIFGPEPVISTGYGVFIISSALCGFSGSLELLELFRFIQGIGAAMLFSSSAVIITRYIPPDWWGRAFGINGFFACIGFALGSPVGGIIQELAGWSWIFFVNVPIGLAGLLLARYLLKKPYHRNETMVIDYRGFVLSLALIGVLAYTLHILSEPFNYYQLMLSVPALCVLVILFVIIEKNAKNPLLDFSLFRDKILNLALSASFFYIIILLAVSFLFPFYLIDLLGYSPSVAGLYLAIPTLSSIALAYLSGLLTDKVGPRIPCIIGMCFCFCSGIAFHGFNLGTSGNEIFISLVFFGIGIGLFVPASMVLIMNQSEEKNRGAISSLKSLVIQFGSIIGLTLFTIIYSLGISTSDLTGNASTNQYMANFQTSMVIVVVCSLISLAVCIAAKKNIPDRDTTTTDSMNYD